MKYKTLLEEEICPELFCDFERRQVVTKCRRKIDGVWTVKDDPFIDQWSETDYVFLVKCLKNTVRTGGVIYGAFSGRFLKSFVSVEPQLFGSKKEYMDLSSLHVSEDFRGRGIGTKLFGMAAGWARAHGAKKLYISSHSAVETQAFYHSLGCVEAVEYNIAHVEREPFDCQLEFLLCL